MQNDNDSAVTAASALVGGVATLIQELVLSGAINPERLRHRLQAFVQQDGVQQEPDAERELIKRVIHALEVAIDIAQEERRENAH